MGSKYTIEIFLDLGSGLAWHPWGEANNMLSALWRLWRGRKYVGDRPVRLIIR